MRFPRSSSVPWLALSALTAAGCSDHLPTESLQGNAPLAFALSESKANAFENALQDLSERVLPSLDLPQPLSTVLSELAAAINRRDANALQVAISRTEAALERIAGSDEENGAIAVELEAIRMVLEEARPLACLVNHNR